MSDPTIPSLALANDQSAMGTNNPDTYGLQFEIDASHDWVYVPEGRFPDYEAQILISIQISETEVQALCASEAAAANILFVKTGRVSATTGTYDDKTNTYSWAVTITAEGAHVIIGKTTPLVIQMSQIKPNDIQGVAKITLLPRLEARPGVGKANINGTPLTYNVDKTSPPMVIDQVTWIPDNTTLQYGPGKLQWKATGTVQSCSLRANGEPIGESSYQGTDSQYQAELILEMGTQFVTITAVDQKHNTATYKESLHFLNFNPWFTLQVSAGRAVSLVQSDQTACLYGVFADSQGTRIWKNGFSGTQDNWHDTHVTLKSGYESSPCVYYQSHYYLVGGSSFDPSGLQSNFLVFDKNLWSPIKPPPTWIEPRIGQAVVLFDEAIWVAGGYGASGALYDDVYSYSKGAWTKQPRLPKALCNASLAAIGTDLYLFGGYVDMPGGTALNDLYLLSGASWVNQKKKPPPGSPAMWALGSVGRELLLFGRFGALAFVGQMTIAPYWQGVGANFADVALPPGDQPPYGFNTVAYGGRLFLVMTDTAGDSAFAYYVPPNLAQKERTDHA